MLQSDRELGVIDEFDLEMALRDVVTALNEEIRSLRAICDERDEEAWRDRFISWAGLGDATVTAEEFALAEDNYRSWIESQ